MDRPQTIKWLGPVCLVFLGSTSACAALFLMVLGSQDGTTGPLFGSVLVAALAYVCFVYGRRLVRRDFTADSDKPDIIYVVGFVIATIAVYLLFEVTIM